MRCTVFLSSIALLISIPDLVLGQVLLPANSSALLFSGRSVVGQGGGRRFDWAGSTLVACVTGASASVVLEETGTNRYGVSLDGGATLNHTFTAARGRQMYPIFQGLEAEVAHEIALIKLTEACGEEFGCSWANFGTTTLRGLLLADGAVAARPHVPWVAGRRLQLIGDSITAGWGLRGTAGDDDSACSDAEDQWLAWGSVLGRSLRSETHVLAWSGIGLVVGDRADPVPADASMPMLWQRALANDPASRWDHGAWAPQAVVIHLGTNDFCCNHTLGEQAFVSNYSRFIQQVAAASRGGSGGGGVEPTFFLGCGPMGGGPSGYFPCSAVERVAASGELAALAVSVLDFSGALDDPSNVGGCGHPSAAGSAAMAERALPQIRQAMGWSDLELA